MKCIFCSKEAEFVFQGNSVCSEHFKVSIEMSKQMQNSFGNLMGNLINKVQRLENE